MHKYLVQMTAIISIIMMITAPYPAYAEDPAPSETTEEKATEKAEEVAPIPVEKVEEIEGAKEAKDEKSEAKEKAEEKPSEAIPTDDVEAIQDAVAIWKALNSQDWPLAAGLIVMLLVYVFNRFGLKEKVGKKAIPYVSLAIGILSAVGIALASGSSLAVALEAGVLAGLAAVGSWEVLFKKILGESADDDITEDAA